MLNYLCTIDIAKIHIYKSSHLRIPSDEHLFSLVETQTISSGLKHICELTRDFEGKKNGSCRVHDSCLDYLQMGFSSHSSV